MAAPAYEGVSTMAGAGRDASSRPPCPTCSRPVPPPLLELPAVVLRALDELGPTSATKLAKRLHRRKASVLAALHELDAAGVATLSQPNAAAGSQRWATLQKPRGTHSEPSSAAGWPSGDGAAVLAGIAALIAESALARRLAFAGFALLVAALVVAARRASGVGA
jgi:membrane-associated phospholipid phosphatase